MNISRINSDYFRNQTYGEPTNDLNQDFKSVKHNEEGYSG